MLCQSALEVFSYLGNPFMICNDFSFHYKDAMIVYGLRLSHDRM